MKTPKFSAEASLYKSNRLYRMNGEIESKIGQVIAPAYASQYYKLTPFDWDWMWGLGGLSLGYSCVERCTGSCPDGKSATRMCECGQHCIAGCDANNMPYAYCSN